MTGRSVKEWLGKTPDSRPPASVKARVFARYNGRCYLSGTEIRPGTAWQVEHIIPLWQDPTGNRESNLAPALVEPHKAKTKAEAPIRAKVNRQQKKHLGLDKPKGKLKGRGFTGWRRFNGEIVRRDAR